jgi:hypothetical protein
MCVDLAHQPKPGTSPGLTVGCSWTSHIDCRQSSEVHEQHLFPSSFSEDRLLLHLEVRPNRGGTQPTADALLMSLQPPLDATNCIGLLPHPDSVV